MEITRRTKIITLITGGIVLLIVLFAFLGLTFKQNEMIKKYVHLTARAYFDNIVITRRWNANYGGVYVLKKEDVHSNPYLEKPDITAVDGRIFTLRNPAMMTRELSELAKQHDVYKYHITSLKLLNPDNAPDPWERKALTAFERGTEEITEITEIEGKKVFRLMRPLFFEKGCSSCHAKQGYKEGDVRGGISVALPYGTIEAALKTNQLRMTGLAVAITAVIGLLFYQILWKMMDKLSKTISLLDAEKKKTEEAKLELVEERNKLDDIVSYIDADLLLLDREMKILWVNKKLKERDSYLRGEIVGQPCNKAYCNIEEVPGDCPAKLAFESGKPVRQEHPITHHDGTLRYYYFTCSPVQDSKGNFTHVLELVQDITGKKMIEDQVKQKAADIEALNEKLRSEIIERKKVEEELQKSASDLEMKNAELEKKNQELERFNKLFVDREFRIKELKERVKELEKGK